MFVIGYERLCFADSKDPSKTVSGVNLYCANPVPADKGEGYSYSKKGYERLYLSDWFVANRLAGEIPSVGSEIRPAYNKDGKLQEILVISSAK